MQIPMLPPLAELIEAFQQLPGVGPKTAQRYAFFMLQQDEEKAAALKDSLQNARETVRHCNNCHMWSLEDTCAICRDTRRNARLICVVESAEDVYALERTQSFNGKYHVLGGLLSPMDGKGPEALNVRSLLDRVEALRQASEHNGAEIEVLFALPPSTQGEMTGLYMARQLKPLSVKTTRLAYGLPVGGDLEYADQLTLSRALEGRQLL